MKFTCLSLVAIASVATADDTTGGNLRSSAASLERHLGGPNENGPCNGICNAFENACDNDCEGGKSISERRYIICSSVDIDDMYHIIYHTSTSDTHLVYDVPSSSS